MSISPMIPDLSTGSSKSFWTRPEGKVGMFVLAALGIGVGLAMWSVILPFLLLMVVDTIHLVMLVSMLSTFFFLITNKRIRSLVSLIFRLGMRFLTGMVIQIDPIGILKDRLQEMRKRREKMAEQISNVQGAIGTLKGTIKKNSDDYNAKSAMAIEAQRRVISSTDTNEATRMKFQAEGNARKAQRLMRSNVSYQQLLNKMETIHSMLSKWLVNIDFYIDDTSDEVRQQEVQYKTINSAYGAYKTAMSVIKGNADENELYNNTMEYLADEANRKLGEIDNFQNVAQNFMDTMDLQNASVNDAALKTLEEYEQRLLTSGNKETAFLLPGAHDSQPTTVSVKPDTDSYDFFK